MPPPVRTIKPQPSLRRRSPRRWGVLGVVAANAVVLVGCGTAPPGGDDDSETSHGGDVTLEHVHGLGIDPADDTLYAGTHHGLIRISPDGELTRVADRVQDYMGFTVVGPGHYLASGHPGAHESGPADLGLIETTDGGQTWTTLSLEGGADFHALDAADGAIYGYSGGRLLVSEDGLEWTDRGEVSIADLAVDPAAPQRVLATTERGPVVSADAGQSFAAVADAPLLLLVDIADRSSAAGVSPDGSVFVSGDGGRTWDERGGVGGAPQALTVNGNDIYVAVDGAVLASVDGGATFNPLHRGR